MQENTNGNGHAISQLCDDAVVQPAVVVDSASAVAPAVLAKDRLQAIIQMLLLELDLDITSQHFAIPRSVSHAFIGSSAEVTT